jgi:hypothetical protein
MTDTKEIQVRNPNDLLAMALSQNVDLDKLERLMVLQERWEKNEAKKAYTEAMAAFKANVPEIIKDATVDFVSKKTGERTKYDHPTLHNAVKTITKELSKHGLSHSWRLGQNEKMITITCVITHIMGHSESTALSGPPDQSGKKNPIQAISSTVSYLERYTLFAITGLAAKGMDDDGRGGRDSHGEMITEDDKQNIELFRKAADLSDEEFKKRLKKGFNVESIDDLTTVQAKKVIKRLQVTISEKNPNNK